MPRIAAALVVFATSAFCIGFNIVRYPVVWERVAAGGQSARAVEPAESTAGETSTESAAYSDPYGASDWGEDSASDTSIVASISGSAEFDERGESWDYADNDRETYAGESYSYDDDDEEDAWGGYSDGGAACPDGVCDTNRGGGNDESDNGWATPDGEYDSFGRRGEEPVDAWSSSEYASNSLDQRDDFSESPGSDRWDADSDLVPVRRPGRLGAAATAPRAPASGGWPVEGADRASDNEVRRLPPIDRVWAPEADRRRPPVLDGSIPIYPSTGIE